MKFTRDTYRDGEEKVVSGFLFFPKTLVNKETGKMETRWLERTSWVRKCWITYSESFFQDMRWA